MERPVIPNKPSPWRAFWSGFFSLFDWGWSLSKDLPEDDILNQYSFKGDKVIRKYSPHNPKRGYDIDREAFQEDQEAIRGDFNRVFNSFKRTGDHIKKATDKVDKISGKKD